MQQSAFIVTFQSCNVVMEAFGLWCKYRRQLESASLINMAKRKTIDELFQGCHFKQESIIHCVR